MKPAAQAKEAVKELLKRREQNVLVESSDEDDYSDSDSETDTKKK